MSKQDELFIINDINMSISPSDIQVMDDNWVMEESYLRSKSVFCFRSKYSATKVVLNIPFQMSYLTDEDKLSLNNTYNCIKLVTELNAYPFCFIRNQRIRTYVSPTSISSSGFMMFAVEEIALVQDAKASNMVFLEVVLQYFNHTALIQDFEFRSNLSVALASGTELDENDKKYSKGALLQDIGPDICDSLRESKIWKTYMQPKVKKVFEGLSDSGLLDVVNANTKVEHPMMSVKLLAPTMFVISEGIENADDGKYVGPGSKIITVSDTSRYDEGTFENLLSTLKVQDFTSDSVFKNQEETQTINSEKIIKKGLLVDKKKEGKDKEKQVNSVPNPFEEVSERDKELISKDSDNESKLKKSIPKGSKDVYIDWVGEDIQNLAMGVQTIEVRKKNKNISHQIGAYKHPIIQHMGKYPLTVNVTMSSVNFDIYKTDEYPVNSFIKNILNILDYNRASIPEAEAYNYIKIKSLATLLFDCEAFLPAQSLVSSSSSSQGLENIVYSFNEGDLTEFMEQSQVEASGRLSTDKANSKMANIIIQYLTTMPTTLLSIVGNKDADNNVNNIHVLETYKLILELAKEIGNELGLKTFQHYEALETAVYYSSDLKPNNNLIRDYIKVVSDVPKEFSKYTLYTKFTRPGAIAPLTGTNPADYQKAIAKQNAEQRTDAAVAEKKKQDELSVKVTTLQFHNGIIPFIIKLIGVRAALIQGKSSTLPSISFTPSGRYDMIVTAIMSKIDSGMKEGVTNAFDKLNSKDTVDFFNTLTTNYSNSFFGYNLEDLDLELLSPITYNREKDVLIPKIDPFFFLKEITHLDGTELDTIYTAMYENTPPDQELIDALNDEDNSQKDEVDATTFIPSIQYRRLQEIDFVPMVTTFSTQNTADIKSLGALGWIVGTANDLVNGTKSNKAKNVPSDIVKAIEDALKKYGMDKNEGFRKYMYSVLLIESQNGSALKSGTGASGIFQFTGYGIREVLELDNRVVDGSGRAIGSRLTRAQSTALTGQIRNKLMTDHFLSAQMFIEKSSNSSKSTLINGQRDPVYSFIEYNIGLGGLTDIRAVLEKRSAVISSETRNNIAKQSKSFIGSNDTQTVKKYYDSIVMKLSVDNIPSSAVKGTVANGLINAATTILDNTKTFIPFKNAAGGATNTKLFPTPLVYQKQYLDKMEASVKEFKKPTVAADSKSNVTQSGNTMTGVITKVNTGGNVTFLDTKTNKTHTFNLYGVAIPSTLKQTDDSDEEEAELNEISALLGKKAITALESLVKGKTVKVQLTGTEKNKGQHAKVVLEDGTDVSQHMLRSGNGLLTQVAAVGVYTKAQADAQKDQKGVWSYPAGIIAIPGKGKVNLSDLTGDAAAKAKNNVNYQKFSNQDFNYAQQANANPLNKYQPFGGGKTYRESAPYGEKRSYGIHKGIDFACPVGTSIVTAASGKVANKVNAGGYGNYVEVDHGNGFVTRYGHLSKFTKSNGAAVAAGEEIGLSGNTGRSTGPHLHYEVRYNGKAVNPYGTKLLTLYKPGDAVGSTGDSFSTTRAMSDVVPELKMSRKGVNAENTVYNEDKLAEAIFKNMNKYTNVGLKTALPAIKVYLTIGNENDKFWLDALKGDVQYYELKGIKSFHMNCNNDGNPIDTVIMSVADPSYLNSDSFVGITKMQGINIDKIGTGYETQFRNNRIQVKPGAKLHIRIGYSNDPNELDIVFNGSVVDVEVSNQSLNLVCEGFGKELMSEIYSPNKPTFLNAQNDNMSTSSVLGEALVSRVIEHFGYNNNFWADKLRPSTDPEDRVLSPGRFSFSYNWFVDWTSASYKSRLFMNTFAPEIETLDNDFKSYSGWISNLLNIGSNHMGGYPFAVYRMTPWDCMKQMEYRHPNTICKPIMYEDRMTLFYGIKEQTCFTRELNKATQILAAEQKKEGEGFDLTSYYENRRERMSPAINMHLLTSNHNLITNGLRINSNYSTVVNVNYYDDLDDALESKPWDLKFFKAQSDDNLYPWDMREKELTLSGCLGTYSAFLYGTTELKKEAEKMYSGKIVMLGNPSIKAGDYVFIDDSEKRMHGVILVRECYHHFDDKNGFITEIVPGQYVEAAHFMYSSLWIKLMCCSKIVTTKMKTAVSSNFMSEDFDMVTSYLTVLRQAELALDKFDKREESMVGPIIANGSLATLSVVLTNSLAKTLGIGSQSALLRDKGINLGAGVTNFTKHFFKLYVDKADIMVFDIAKSFGKDWVDTRKTDIRGLLKNSKAMVGSTLFGDKYAAWKAAKATKTESGLVWRAARPLLGWGGKALQASVKVLARTFFTSLIAASVSNPLTILIDIIVMFAVSWAWNKVEESKLTRQPLLYFPLVRNGKPYVGGMAGVVRNTWLDAKKTEGSKTIKEVQKAAQILSGNAKVNGNENSIIAQLLNGVAVTGEKKVTVPLYQNDFEGNQMVVKNNKVVVVGKETANGVKEVDEDLLKKQLIQKTNKEVIDKSLELRGDN